MLGSAHDGEVVNAARAAKRELDRMGWTFGDLATGGAPAADPRVAQYERIIRQQDHRIAEVTKQAEERRRTIVAREAQIVAKDETIKRLRHERDEAVGKLRQREMRPDLPGRQAAARGAIGAMIGIFGPYVPKDLAQTLARAAHVVATGRDLDMTLLRGIEALYMTVLRKAQAEAEKAVADADVDDMLSGRLSAKRPEPGEPTPWMRERFREAGYGKDAETYWLSLPDETKAIWRDAERRAAEARAGVWSQSEAMAEAAEALRQAARRWGRTQGGPTT